MNGAFLNQQTTAARRHIHPPSTASTTKVLYCSCLSNLHRGSPLAENLKFKFNVAMTFRHPVILVVWQSFPIEEVRTTYIHYTQYFLVVVVGKFLKVSPQLLSQLLPASSSSTTFRRVTSHAYQSYGFLSKDRGAWLQPSRIVCHQPITRPAIHRDPRLTLFQRQTSALQRLEGTFAALARCSSEPSCSWPQLSRSLLSEQTDLFLINH